MARAPLRLCLSCHRPHRGRLCSNPDCYRSRRGAHGAGYDRAHQLATKAAIEAEPWCHTWPECPHPDSTSPMNPLTGGHLRTRSECASEAEWRRQPIVPQCLRCNSGRAPLEPPRGPL